MSSAFDPCPNSTLLDTIRLLNCSSVENILRDLLAANSSVCDDSDEHCIPSPDINASFCTEAVNKLLGEIQVTSCVASSEAPKGCQPRGPTVIFPPPQSVWLFIVIAVMAIRVVGVLGNLIVLVAIIKVPGMRTPLYYSLANLAVADIMFLSLAGIIPVGELFDRPSGYVGYTYCYVSAFLEMGPSICSISIVLFISFERYIAVSYPLKVRNYFSGRRLVYYLVPIWLISFSVGIPFPFFTEYYTADENCGTVSTCFILILVDWMKAYEIAMILVFRLSPVVILTVLYALMIRKLRKKSNIVSGTGDGKKTQAVYMMGGVSLLFVVCIVPFGIIQLMFIFLEGRVFTLDPQALKAFIWGSRLAAYVNSAANPIIYAIVSADFRSMIASACKRRTTRTFMTRSTFATTISIKRANATTRI